MIFSQIWYFRVRVVVADNRTTLKQPLGMTSIFVFSFVMKWCIPQIMILFFSKFLDFYKYFLSTFLWNRLKPKQTLCIPKHLLKDDRMFLQHRATCWCRRPSVGQTISVAGIAPPCPDYKTPISGNCLDLPVQDVGICGIMCCILLTCFVYMAIYDLEI